ncbi:MAG: uroporphyrinogen-III C-methyltransferase [Gammaproteobacteria bacterium]
MLEPSRCAVSPPSAGAPAPVKLVGGGPGDPELLTLKAWRALREARLVLHDQLVGDDILALVPADAERIDVGKHAGRHTLPQEQIIELMIRLAKAGRPVLRLKGGDPFIFGRGGEEAQALAAAGIPFEVIPGITAAQGAGALAGIPLTHRDHAQTLVFATGHLRADDRAMALDWASLARPHQTVVIYMGVGALAEICRELIAHGRAAQTPAALVENIARPNMRTVTGTLQTLPALAARAEVRPPALIVIGEVVALHAMLGPRAPGAASVLAAFGAG